MHLTEVCIDVLPTLLVELSAADLLCKAGNTDDISGLHVFSKEITTCLGHILNLVSYRKQQK